MTVEHKRRKLMKGVTAAIVFSSCVGTGTSSTVTGKVYDLHGAPVANASLQVFHYPPTVDQAVDNIKQTSTQSDGTYKLFKNDNLKELKEKYPNTIILVAWAEADEEGSDNLWCGGRFISSEEFFSSDNKHEVNIDREYLLEPVTLGDRFNGGNWSKYHGTTMVWREFQENAHDIQTVYTMVRGAQKTGSDFAHADDNKQIAFSFQVPENGVNIVRPNASDIESFPSDAGFFWDGSTKSVGHVATLQDFSEVGFRNLRIPAIFTDAVERGDAFRPGKDEWKKDWEKFAKTTGNTVIGATPLVGDAAAFNKVLGEYWDIFFDPPKDREVVDHQTGNGQSAELDLNEHDVVKGGHNKPTSTAVFGVRVNITQSEPVFVSTRALWKNDGINHLDHRSWIGRRPPTPGNDRE